jgi:hypothetical protein
MDRIELSEIKYLHEKYKRKDECIINENHLLRKTISKMEANHVKICHKVDISKTRFDNELLRLNSVLNTKNIEHYDCIRKTYKLELFKKCVEEFLDLDTDIVVNEILLKTVDIECDWFYSTLFKKNDYIALIVDHFKQYLCDTVFNAKNKNNI